MDEKKCIRCDEDDRRAVTLLCEEHENEACTVGVDPFEKTLNILVRVGEDFHEFSEAITHCPWCGREL